MKKNLSLYRKYRPQNFAELLGQPGAVGILQRALRENRVSHAYLFSGPRGCGKTSMARIFAKALNCKNLQEGPEPCGVCSSCESIRQGDNLDVVEIDAASNRGIDEIRELKDQVALAPYEEQWKIYIIDEVHMLTEHAFNALLKTLEEPPEYALFILATTEPHKVPVTIRSRCQHLPFHRIPGEIMVSLLEEVARKEGSSPSPEALWEIARHGDGALRDALSLLEQALVLEEGTLTLQSVQRLLGGSGRKELEDLVALLRESPGEAYARFHELLGRGGSVVRLYEGMFRLFSDLWTVGKWGDQVLVSLDLSEKEKEYLLAQAPLWDPEKLWRGMDFLSSWLPRLRMGIDGELLGGLLWSKVTGNIPSAETPAHSEGIPEKEKISPSRSFAEASPVSEKFLRKAPRDFRDFGKQASRENPRSFSEEPKEKRAPELPGEKESFKAETPDFAGESSSEAPVENPFSGDSSWEKLLGRLFTEAPWLCCALVDVEPLSSENEIRLDFPPSEGKHRFFLTSSSRGQELLRPLFEEFYGEKSLVLTRGEVRKNCFSGEAEEEKEEEGFPEDPEKKELSPKPLFEEIPFFEDSFQENGNEERHEKAFREDQGFVGTVLSCAGGEVLLEKREGAEDAALEEMEGDLLDQEE
ncbi:MAG TPA: DNA polymerase III subunit gamma/tau [Synergistaceae bacterium]|nr:DNA polymerase III subunit gamma/tau [Synergistaceae bacterium]HPJ26083.1 DNA polymerase III subunit gamma/tau [Synergistaceae bacterium]HPQ37847.1 DNA polymerase III subunit gamma/tau [Synergistaceae bacterium]